MAFVFQTKLPPAQLFVDRVKLIGRVKGYKLYTSVQQLHLHCAALLQRPLLFAVAAEQRVIPGGRIHPNGDAPVRRKHDGGA